MRTTTKFLRYSFLTLFTLTAIAFAEPSETNEDENVSVPDGQSEPAKPRRKKENRKYVTDHPERSDAGIFHVGFAAGGNFYVEPKLAKSTRAPVGDYFKDFGFQAGVYFDYDYSQMPENIPLGLRGFIGYKYILASTHVFDFEWMVRRMFNFSEDVAFGVGLGASAAVWYRTFTDTSETEEIIFLPSVVAGAGFEFNPFMVDFKWLINRFGQDSTITGFELYFGFRL